MRILYLYQYFSPPTRFGVGYTGVYEMSRRLVQAGHHVEVVTTRVDPDPDTPRGWYTTEEQGIIVHWLALPYANEMGFRQRLQAFFGFALRSLPIAARLARQADVIIAASTPLTIAIPAIYAQRRSARPLVFQVRDLWPEAPVQMGVLRNPALIALARGLEAAAYRHATLINALSPGMMEGVLRTERRAERVCMIPNGCDLELFSPQTDGTPLRQQLGLQGKFVLAYFGTMGPSNGLDYVLDAAAELLRRGAPGDIVLLLHGKGKLRPALQRRVQDEGLIHVQFSAAVAQKSVVAQLTAAADVCMVTYSNKQILQTNSPNKLFDALAAGRPVIVNMRGWVQSLIQDNHCGVAADPETPADFADKVMQLYHHRDELVVMGHNARELAEREFSRDMLATQLESLLQRAVKLGPVQRGRD
jgi:glycosyltransferase involved in cell wall biosynthesis